MDNRRNTNLDTDKPPFNREKRDDFQKRTDDRGFGERRYSNDNTYQPRGDRFQPRTGDTRTGENRSYPPRDNRFQQPRDDRFNKPRDDRFPPREGSRYPPRPGVGSNQRNDQRNDFRPRDNNSNTNTNFRPRDDKYPPRDNRFQSRPPAKFDPSKKRFPPRGAKPAESWKKVDNSDIKIVSPMQITDGKHRGKYFKTTTSPKVKMTSRAIREAMFKVILRRVRGGRFLDLCAGSGLVGLEAISRGALLSTFVERSAKMCAFIKKNMDSLEIKEGHGEIHEIETVPFLMQMAKRRRQWDVVFLDPPYDANYDEMLEFLKRGVCIKPHGALVIEHHAEMFFPEKLGALTRWRVIVEGDSAVSFYERK